MTTRVAPPKRRRTDGEAATDGCAHFSSAAAFYTQQLRERAAANASSKSATRDVELLGRYCDSSVTVSK